MTHRATVRERARELVEEGYSYCHVADVVHATHETIGRWSKEGNWQRREPKLPPLAEKRLRLLVLKGYSCAVVGRQLGIYPRKLKRLVKDRGLEFASYERSCALAVTLKKGKLKVWEDMVDRKANQELAERINRGELVY